MNELAVAHSAWFGAPIAEFLATTVDEVIGRLSRASGFADVLDQKLAWQQEVEILRDAVAGLDGWIYLEFDVPRLGSRIDAVVVTGSAVVPIEFKVGEGVHKRSDFEQAWDYGLDLKNFHEASHGADVFPVLVATEAKRADVDWQPPHADGVRPPLRTSTEALHFALRRAREHSQGDPINGMLWGKSRYRPTPTIVQAARALYAGHSVREISRNDAGARNLSVTSKRVDAVIQEAREQSKKSIVFVTGVPGAGKTLVGLDVATRRRERNDALHAVYLSGNGPLVAVLREALTRDELVRLRAKGEKPRRGAVEQPVKAFIQNVHHFRDEGLRDRNAPPVDRIVIFDEAQRAWDQAKTASFMKRRKNLPNFAQSEPEFLLSYMNRHTSWAVVICLVGSGQEIHTGEAGIASWLKAIGDRFPDWQVHVSSNVADADSEARSELRRLETSSRVCREVDLHLESSMRSFRAESVSNFVRAVLDGEVDMASSLLAEFASRYPLAMTRRLDLARTWIREHARGSERFGLVASSQAQRLKPHAIDVRVNVDPVHWFLDGANDTRSSFYLEDAATEFQTQGLELDWVGVTWDADLRRADGAWSFHSFRGDGWTVIHKPERRRYLVNAYRVLLTRARQGMIIFVPPGDEADATRLPSFYDETATFLMSSGIPEIV